MVLEDIPGHKEHYHLLAKDDRSYRTRADINSVNIRVVRKPFNIHLLILAIISIFIVVHQIVIMTYESENDFGVLYVVQAPSRPNRSKKDDILDELRVLSKEELIEIRKDIIKLINDK